MPQKQDTGSSSVCKQPATAEFLVFELKDGVISMVKKSTVTRILLRTVEVELTTCDGKTYHVPAKNKDEAVAFIEQHFGSIAERVKLDVYVDRKHE